MGASYTESPSASSWLTLPSDLWTSWKTVRSRRKTVTESRYDDRFNSQPAKPHRSGSPPPRGVIRRLLYSITSILSLLWYLIPRRGKPLKTGELHQLAYLDALRGYMALVIYTMHVTNNNWKWAPYFFLKTPIFQFPFRGGYTCLAMFFWISGYVITYRALGFIHTKQPLKMLDTISSIVFRRYFRLFLPALPFTLLVVVGTNMGFVVPNESQRRDGVDDMKKAYFKDNLYWWWVQDSIRELNPFADIRGFHNGAFGSRILPPLWSLCTEFRSTLMLSVFLIGTYKLSRSKRNTLIWLCVPVFVYYENAWAAMAFVGMWFADCRQHKNQQEKARGSLPVAAKEHYSEEATKSPLTMNSHGQPINETENTSPTTRKNSISLPVSNNQTGSQKPSFYKRYEQPILVAVFLYSFFLVYDPDDSERSRYFPNRIFQRLEAPWWHGRSRTDLHLYFGALTMLYPIDQSPLLQRPLRARFSQYLGELSFGIYVTHYVIRWIVWEPLYIKYLDDRKIDYAAPHRMMPAWVLMTICVLWMSELFRLIDNQVVVFCKWLEKRMFE